MRKGFTLIELMIVVAIIAIIAAIAIPSLLRSRIAANETAAVGALKQITSHQSSIAQTDGDGNGIKDYWTLDIAGLYALEDVSGNMVKYIDVQMAKADDNASALGYATFVPSVADAGISKSGYLYRALITDEDAAAYVTTVVDGNVANTQLGVAATNRSRYGFVSYPEVYGRGGVRVFIVNEEGVVYGVDNGNVATTPKADYITLDGVNANQWPGQDPTAVAGIGLRNWSTAD